jgi:hypothetical protein
MVRIDPVSSVPALMCSIFSLSVLNSTDLSSRYDDGKTHQLTFAFKQGARTVPTRTWWLTTRPDVLGNTQKSVSLTLVD